MMAETSRRSRRARSSLLLLLVAAPLGCRKPNITQGGPSSPPPSEARSTWTTPLPPPSEAIIESIFDGGRKGPWQDWGWARHDDIAGGAARIDMSNWAGWQLVRPGLEGNFGGLKFRFQAPADYGDFLTVHLERDGKKDFPTVKIDAAHQRPNADGYTDVLVPMEELNPDGGSFDHVIFFVSKSVPSGLVSFDKIGLTLPRDPSTLPPPPTTDVAMSVDCSVNGTPIHPMIYGIAFDVMHDAKDHQQWTMGATARRWGGNPSSRYNWALGNAWNTASDWYFENVNYTGDAAYSYAAFLKADLDHGVSTALTVPMLGWVAKDTSSVGFSKSAFGGQDNFDPYKPDAGDGKKGGKPLDSGAPTLTSVEAPPAFIQRWIEAIRREDTKRGVRSVHQYILDNEPNLWSSTHRDVHPKPLSYDELLEKTIAYGSAIRAADPDAVIAGPAEWGWTNYLYSSQDMVHGVTARLDRRSHGDVPLVAWYLKSLADYEKKTGKRVLDVLDLHFYPQTGKVYSPASDRETASLRIRSTRGLWDPTYVDESWIKEAVMLLPRMKTWIAENYPGRGISIGEWSFGGEQHMSGALAIAEALGRFGQNDVTSAFYWTYPPENSPGFWAFRAFRNFDGKGRHFERMSLPTTAGAGTSLFASRDDERHHVVLIALNLAPDAVRHATIDMKGCAGASTRRAYVYRGEAQGFPDPILLPREGPLVVNLPPSSITVLDLDLTL